jgi:predicted DCC family thiol-disulfide oxidoreductase YuxK
VLKPDGSRDLLLYDGLCGFCDGFARFVLKRDGGTHQFAPLQSPAATRRLAALGLDRSRLPDSLVLLTGSDVLVRSAAGLRVLSRLGFGWRLAARLVRLLPGGWRDGAYDLFARHRHRLFDRRHECALPEAPMRGRFLWD